MSFTHSQLLRTRLAIVFYLKRETVYEQLTRFGNLRKVFFVTANVKHQAESFGTYVYTFYSEIQLRAHWMSDNAFDCDLHVVIRDKISEV